MAPDLLDDILRLTKPGEVILDPMAGSGTVLAKALRKNRNAIGLDMDPLAVLLSRAVACATDVSNAQRDIDAVLASAQTKRCDYASLPWMRSCAETLEFVQYWFGVEQSTALARLAKAIREHRFRTAQSRRLALIALSRTIITKHSGASLAWDISHSRPHIKKTSNDYDVFEGFARAAATVIEIAEESRPNEGGQVFKADARHAHRLVGEVDHVITSPPYLNAIDYLRGHKFSLVWMGHTIPELRGTRATTIGAERSPARADDADLALIARRSSLKDLPSRQRGHLTRYIGDMRRLVHSLARCVRAKGTMTAVIGNSTLRGAYIPNSEFFHAIAKTSGFDLMERYTRRIDAGRRYLPERDDSKSLDRRMRTEVVLRFKRRALAVA